MSFYHWFSSHPNEITLSGDTRKMQDIAKELRIVDAKQEARPKQTDFRRISSVPDIWSQHRLFEMLLLNTAEDPSYLEYEAIAKREWRAMLAILVLAESYGVKIYTETIRFSDKVSSAYLRSAYNTRPNAESWPSMEIYYIKAGDVSYPVAMSSPTVHVIPTKDAWRNLRVVYDGQIPWLTDNQVHAPVVDDDGRATPFMLGEKEAEKAPAMMPVHALLLQRWLEKYRETLAAEQKRNAQATVKQEVRLIQEFEDALTEAFRLVKQRMPDMSSFFTAAEQQDGMKIGDLHVPKDLRLFLDRAFYSMIDQASSLPKVLDTHRFAGGIGEECLVSKMQPDGKWAHFFVAMPVTAVFWRLWRDNERLNPVYALESVFSPDGVYLNKIRASVAIGDITFSKTYNVAQIDSDPWRNLCVAGIWPRQKISDWEDYYLFCNAINGYRVEPENENMITYEKTYSDKEGLEGTLNYYKLNSAPESCKLFKDNKLIGFMQVRERQMILPGEKTSVYRASIDFGTSATTLYGGVDDNEPGKISGMNLWSLPLINTVDEAGSEKVRLEKFFFPPLPIPLNKTVLNQSKSEATTVSFENLQKNQAFSKAYQDCIPMQTVLADLVDDNDTRQIFGNSWIFFRSFMFPRQNYNWPKMHSNLKWNQVELENHNRIKAILTEIFMMIALEARINRCGKLSVIASYPLSFNDHTKKSYYASVDEMLQVVAGLTGTGILLPPTDNNKTSVKKEPLMVSRISESEAVYRYSISGDRYNQNYFVIDIGGGSTDIFLSLVDNGHKRNSFATSLGFGARTILIDKILLNDKEILKMLTSKSGIKPNQAIRDITRYILSISKNNGHSYIEDFLSMRNERDMSNPAAVGTPENFGESFLNVCAESSIKTNILQPDQQEKSAQYFLELKKRIAFFLAASVWLSGLMIRENKNIDMNVSLLFAGNGSKMIRWLSPDMERIRHFVTLLFQQSYQIAIPREKMNWRFSSRPKEEVAYGALSDFPAGFIAEEGSKTTQVKFGGVSTDKEEQDAFKDDNYESKNISTDAVEFSNFMREYKRIARLSFGWEFFENEYEEEIISNSGIIAAIKRQQPDNGYFLNAVDVVAGFYLGSDKKDLAT
jgi:hypothetical protein